MHPTFLFGLDGATFTILDPLMENGTMPFLREFTRHGVRAGLLSTPVPLTPPAWISLMTGRNPGNHGVFDFIWAEERPKDFYFTMYNQRDIQCETIWSIVSRSGGRVGCLNFPMMAPPPAINGFVMPGLVSWKHLRLNVHPPELYPQLQSLPDFNPREIAWDFELEKKAAKGVPPEEFENWIKFHIRRERQWFQIMRYLMQNHPCDLTSIVFDGPDKILHIGWRFLDTQCFPAKPSAWERQIRDLCLQYFQELDGFLAELAALAGPEARIFMASDHGFGPSWEVLRINTWLYDQGYLTWKGLDDLDDKNRQGYEKLIDQHFVLLDWEKTTAFASTTTSNGIYIRTAKEPGGTGVPPEQYQAFRRDLMDNLLAITDPESGEPVIKHIFTREEAYPGNNNGQAPDLTLVLRDHGFISILNKTPVVYRRPEIVGTHYPEGIFLGRGPGVQPGASLPPFSILGVAPALLHSLGLAIPADFEEGLVPGIFESSFLQEHPVRQGKPTQPPDSYALKPVKTAAQKEEEEEIYKQLRALGYLE
jgi:predicted AlkP superfamily phosphohydrolase/phosphomutase